MTPNCFVLLLVTLLIIKLRMGEEEKNDIIIVLELGHTTYEDHCVIHVALEHLNATP